MTTTWQFEGTDIWFTSPTETLDKSILSYRKRLNNYESKIIFYNGTTNHSTTSDTSGSNGSAGATSQPTVSVGTKKGKTKSKALELQPVHRDVATAASPTDVLEDNPDLSLLNGPGDRLAL